MIVWNNLPSAFLLLILWLCFVSQGIISAESLINKNGVFGFKGSVHIFQVCLDTVAVWSSLLATIFGPANTIHQKSTISLCWCSYLCCQKYRFYSTYRFWILETLSVLINNSIDPPAVLCYIVLSPTASRHTHTHQDLRQCFIVLSGLSIADV